MFEPKRQQYGLPVSPRDFVPAHIQPYSGSRASEHGYFDEPEISEGFDPLKLLWYAVHYRWLILAALATAVVCGFVYTWVQTPLYRGTANLEIVTSGARVFQDLEVTSQSTDFRIFETAKLKMQSRELARRVVFELNLGEDEKFLTPVASFSVRNLFARAFQTSGQNQTTELDAQKRAEIATSIIRADLSVNLVRNTSILAVSFVHPDPKYSADVANQIALSFIDQGVDRKGETSELARQFIEEQVRETKEKLQSSEKELVAYAKGAGITVTGTDSSLISQNINEINKALADAIQERLGAERYLQQVKEGNAATLPEVFESKSIQDSKQKIAELKASYSEKLSTLKPGFPEMQRLQAQIRELEKQVNLEIKSIARSIEIKHEQTVQKVAALQTELTALEVRQSEYQDKNIQYTILKREVDSNRAQYDSLISKFNDIGVGSELKTANAQVIDAAVPPGAPYSPRLVANLAVSLALFSLLAVALMYILEMMNNTFAVPDQIESTLKLPVLGIIPHSENADFTEIFNDTKSPISEAYRSLRTSLQFAGAETSMRTLAVTSSVPSEGKSTTAFKLAQDFAALGRKVLIIDADLRRPRLHRLFNTDNSIGLSNLLSNVVRQGEVASIFRSTSDANITFMAAGTIPPNPVDLLTSQKMAMTLHYCTKRFDLVVVDCPPVMGLSDAPILSRQVDATLLVVSSKHVTRKAAQTAMTRLRSVGGNVVGAALTKFQVSKLDYNYAYKYMQYNYYSYDSDTAEIENYAKGGKQAEGTKTQGGAGGIMAAFFDRVRGFGA